MIANTFKADLPTLTPLNSSRRGLMLTDGFAPFIVRSAMDDITIPAAVPAASPVAVVDWAKVVAPETAISVERITVLEIPLRVIETNSVILANETRQRILIVKKVPTLAGGSPHYTDLNQDFRFDFMDGPSYTPTTSLDQTKLFFFAESSSSGDAKTRFAFIANRLNFRLCLNKGFTVHDSLRR